MTTVNIDHTLRQHGDAAGITHIDVVEMTSYGIMRVSGWSSDPEMRVAIRYGDEVVNADALYRTNRQDVDAYLGVASSFAGFNAEFRITRPDPFFLKAGAETIYFVNESAVARMRARELDMARLFYGEEVLHRDQVYGEGPPNPNGHPDIIALAMTLKGPILDFGCGTGYMMRRWLDAGVEDVRGIEIDRQAIRDAMPAEMGNRITLYDGVFPLPYEDGEFESVFSSEVIEHVPNYLEAIAEIARVCRGTFTMTVPDMASVPIGSQFNIVPWHLLEATHVNFFNRRSLAKVLDPYFEDLEFFNLGAGMVEGAFIPGSLGCRARVRSHKPA